MKRDPVFANQTTALDQFFGHDGSSDANGGIFTDDLFDGKEYVLKLSSRVSVFTGNTDTIFYPSVTQNRLRTLESLRVNSGFEATASRSTRVRNEEAPARLFRFRLYTLTESYYLYLRSLMALDGSTFQGDMADLGLTSPIRVYSHIEGGGTRIVATYAGSFLSTGF